MAAMLLAGDIGGTKTLLGLFDEDADRPAAVEVGEFVTLDYDGLEMMVREFLRARNVPPRAVHASCFGVAGAVTAAADLHADPKHDDEVAAP